MRVHMHPADDGHTDRTVVWLAYRDAEGLLRTAYLTTTGRAHALRIQRAVAGAKPASAFKPLLAAVAARTEVTR
jgi:hypothetical protein